MTNTRVDDKRLRDLYEQVLVTRDGSGRRRCASPEALLAVVRRDGPEEERLATLDHVMACAECARELELVRAIEDAGVRSGADGRVDAESTTGAPEGSERAAPIVPFRPGTRVRRYAPLALAASVLVAVGVAVVQRNGRPGDDDVPRGSSGVTLLAPPNDVRAGANTVSFAWRPVAGTTRYVLEVLDTAGVVRFAAATRDTTVTLTDLRRLTPAAEYRWWVRATDAAGAQRVSAMRSLRFRSK